MKFESDWTDICPEKKDMGKRLWEEEILAVSSGSIMMKNYLLKLFKRPTVSPKENRGLIHIKR